MHAWTGAAASASGAEVMTDEVCSVPDGTVERINKIAVEGLSHPDADSLLHAYIACLSIPDLCLTITETLAAPRSSAWRCAAGCCVCWGTATFNTMIASTCTI